MKNLTTEDSCGICRSMRQETLQLVWLTCLRCGKKWLPRKPEMPGTCPRCRSPLWDRPREIPAQKAESEIAR